LQRFLFSLDTIGGNWKYVNDQVLRTKGGALHFCFRSAPKSAFSMPANKNILAYLLEESVLKPLEI